MLKLADVPDRQGAPNAAAQDGSAMFRPQHVYYAFLSYSHKDQEFAQWLHDELEAFHVPRSLAGQLTTNGIIPSRLTPIFRDRQELAAADDLTVEIGEALTSSRFLIVLCSPDAAKSRWTNAEIETFKRVRREGCVLAAIVDGEPFASDLEDHVDEECFPPALRHRFDKRGRITNKRAEPIAADFREGKDGRRLAFLKLVAGMLGVGLDDLVRREQTRRQRRLAWLAAASIAGMGVTSTLAIMAVQSRDAARDQRRQAESLVAFMLGDLKDKLEPLGRLDVLDSVGARALAYYQNQDTAELSDDALAQRSKALTLMGQVASNRGDLAKALGFYQAAFDGTAEALRRSPDNPQRIFDHAQNVFYVGDVARSRGDLKTAELSAREYKKLAQRLVAADSSNPKWQMEAIYADSNLGVLLNDQGRYPEAGAVFANALVDRERLVAADPGNEQYRKAMIEVVSWLGDTREKEGRLDDALAQRERQIALLSPIVARPGSDVEYRRQMVVAYRAAGRLNAVRGDAASGAAQLQKSIALADQLVAAEPSNTDWTWLSGWSKFDLARLDLGRNSIEEAAALVRSGCDINNRLMAKDATVVEWRVRMRGECMELTTRVALARGAQAEAEDDAARMLQGAKDELVKNKSTDARLALANAYVMTGIVARAGSRRADSARAFNFAATTWPKDLPDRPSLIARKVLIMRGLGRGSDALQLAGKLDRMGYREPIYLRDAASLRSL
ncbi:TIR domain-containing protein [Sphingomonas hankyongi]|uniref:TIR domain-containing protein n=1 Tax=Sphingomonas hankyongi TaxID=2908209 RepID=A0ABT0S4N2_9SPHN|nr:TIR domain-containing protein [Sphingomonas hankyongi]MCL6730830.1 TIR domain-containing protein [Sphingomonas hankyongi]